MVCPIEAARDKLGWMGVALDRAPCLALRVRKLFKQTTIFLALVRETNHNNFDWLAEFVFASVCRLDNQPGRLRGLSQDVSHNLLVVVVDRFSSDLLPFLTGNRGKKAVN